MSCEGNYSVTLRCPVCDAERQVTTFTQWEGPKPSAGLCPTCNHELSWDTDEMELTRFEAVGMSLGEAPTEEITIEMIPPPPMVVTAKCPWCGRMHSSDAHDIDWYFFCCGHTRLVWRLDLKGAPELLPVEEDFCEGAD